MMMLSTRLIFVLVALLAPLAALADAAPDLSDIAQAHYYGAMPGLHTGAGCPNEATYNDGCYNSGSIQRPLFFKGFASQSVGVTVPAGTYFGNLGYGPYTSLQPAVYPNRPAWQVAGVDYAVGQPRWLSPTLTNLHPSSLKDPALVATDTKLNPLGQGENCQFYANNAAYAGGVMPGTSTQPQPSSWSGPFIYCRNGVGGSATPLVFDGYNFGWNSVTGWDCVNVNIGGAAWGTNARNTGPDDANIVFRNSLFLNGPNCNINGGLYQGPGTTGGGPLSPSYAEQVILQVGAINSISFHHNTIYGCGGDANRTALEIALCSQTFNATSYTAGSITGYISGATVGVAPSNNHPFTLNGGGNVWMQYNAFMHLAGRGFVESATNYTNHTEYIDHNYVEGMNYFLTLWAQFSSIVCTANCSSPSVASPSTELVTTLAPHGVPIGGYASMVLAGSAGGWGNVTWTMQAIDATHLQMMSSTNPGDYHYASGAYPTLTDEAEHAEFFEYGFSTALGASYNSTITGNTLTINSLTSGTVATGQYITPAGTANAVIVGSISGNVLTVNSLTSGALAVGQYISGTGIPTNTYIATGSGTSWTLTQAPLYAVSSVTITAKISIPGGTYITAGSGTSWTLSQSLTNPITGNMVNPKYAGNVTTVYLRYNTILWPASQSDVGEASIYLSCGTENGGLPFCVFAGDLSYNVFVTNIIPNGTLRRVAASNAAFGFEHNDYVGLTVHDNWIDPTGSAYCMVGEGGGDLPGTVSIYNNVNLLNASDPYINLLGSYAVLGFNSGTAANNQAQNGITYNSATGIATVTMPILPAGVAAGTPVELVSVTTSQGSDYLNWFWPVVSVPSANTITVNVGSGYPGLNISPAPGLKLTDTVHGNQLNCYGNNLY